MSVGPEQSQVEKMDAVRSSRQMLLWAAVFSTLFGALYLLGLAGKLIVDGSVHSTSSPAVQSVSAAVALLWNVSLLILFAALRRQVARSRRPFAEVGLIFMTLVCATSSVDWFIQLAILPRMTTINDTGMAALLDVHNELSIPYAMEHLGWGLFFGMAALFAAAAMAGSGREAWIRWLLAAAGVLSMLHFIGVIAASPVLSDLGYIAWGVLLPAVTALLAVRFKTS